MLGACGGGGDDQKDQRTMKTLGRDIVGGSGSLSLCSLLSLSILAAPPLSLYGFVSFAAAAAAASVGPRALRSDPARPSYVSCILLPPKREGFLPSHTFGSVRIPQQDFYSTFGCR